MKASDLLESQEKERWTPSPKFKAQAVEAIKSFMDNIVNKIKSADIQANGKKLTVEKLEVVGNDDDDRDGLQPYLIRNAHIRNYRDSSLYKFESYNNVYATLSNGDVIKVEVTMQYSAHWTKEGPPPVKFAILGVGMESDYTMLAEIHAHVKRGTHTEYFLRSKKVDNKALGWLTQGLKNYQAMSDKLGMQAFKSRKKNAAIFKSMHSDPSALPQKKVLADDLNPQANELKKIGLDRALGKIDKDGAKERIKAVIAALQSLL